MAAIPLRRMRGPTPIVLQPVVSIVVGNGATQKTFSMPQALLTSHSDYFDDICKEWDEGSERKHDLTEDDPAAFEVFALFAHDHVIYSASSDKTSREIERGDHDGVKALSTELGLLQDCWLLGDKLRAVEFKDATMDPLVDIQERTGWCLCRNVCKSYPYTAGPSPLRRLIVDMAVFTWEDDYLAELGKEPETAEFWGNVAFRQRNAGPNPRQQQKPYLVRNCDYHEHGNKPCFRTLARKGVAA